MEISLQVGNKSIYSRYIWGVGWGLAIQKGMNIMNHKKVIPVISLLVAGAVLAGCSQAKTEANREIIQKPHQQITVIDTAADGKADSREIQVEQIEKLKDVFGRTWLSDHEIILNRDNVLMIRDLNSKAERRLTGKGDAGQYLAVISPDGKHVIFTGGNPKDKYDIEGHILDIATGKITNVQKLSIQSEISWADNEHVIVGTDEGQINLIDLQGKRTNLKFEDPEPPAVPNFVKKVGERIYYLGEQKGYPVLKMFTLTQPKVKTIIDGTNVFNISPDGKTIAVEKREWNTTKDAELQLIDADGKKLGTVGKGTLLGRGSWSPDGTKIAFSIYTEGEQGMKGLYIFDQTTGKTTPLSTEIQAYDSPAVWSPDGKSLMMYQTFNEGEKSYDITYVIHLK